MTGDGTYTYEWDAEGRLKSVNSGALRSFIYNALGRQAEWHGDGRVSEVVTDLAGHVVGSVNPSSGAWEGERIPGGKVYLAWYVNGGTTFPHYNALGSTVMNIRQDGSVSNDILFYPWGQVWTSPVNDYFQFFGSIEGWDWEMGEGVTRNRYYPNTQGRWLSPDPLAGDISNPQSLNRYAYVLNNPTSLIDPLGLEPKDPRERHPDSAACGNDPGHFGSATGSFGLDEFDLAQMGLLITGPSAFCPAQFQSCLQTSSGAMIGLNGPAAATGSVFTFGQSTPCGPADQERGNCTPSLGGMTIIGEIDLNTFQFKPDPSKPVPPTAQQIPPAVKPTNKYLNFVACGIREQVFGFFGTDDKIEATLKANITPPAFFVVNKTAGVVAAVLAAAWDLNIMLQARTTCAQEVYGRHP